MRTRAAAIAILLLGFALLITWGVRGNDRRGDVHTGPVPKESRDGNPPPGLSHSLRVTFLTHDGQPCPKTRFALIRTGSERQPITVGESDDAGSVELFINVALPLRLLACRLDGRGLFWADAALTERTGRVQVTFPREASLQGTLLDEDSRPVANAAITITMGWRHGMDDPLYSLFNRLMGTERTLRLVTDGAGAFDMPALPLSVFIGIQQLASERGPWRYRIETDLARHRATAYAAPAPAAYRVRITRLSNPVVRVTVHTANNAGVENVLVTVRIQRQSTDAQDHWVFSGWPDKHGSFVCPIVLADSDDPAALSGRPIWIAVFHPDVGISLAETTLDVSSWRVDIRLAPPLAPHTARGAVIGEGDAGGYEGILRSEFFPGMDLMRFKLDATKSFRIDGLAAAPAHWPLDQGESLYRIELRRNGHAVRMKTASDSNVRLDQPMTIELLPDLPGK